MTSSPDLIHELRASRPSAPLELRARVREIAAAQPKPAPWASWRFPVRRGVLVAVPAAVAVVFATAGVIGLASSDAPSTEALRQSGAADAPATTEAGKQVAPAQDATALSAGDRAQRVSATLTVEVSDSDAVSRAAQDALDLTRSLGGLRRVVVGCHRRRGKCLNYRARPSCQGAGRDHRALGAGSHRLAAGDDRRSPSDSRRAREAGGDRSERDRARSGPASSRRRSTPRRKRCSARSCRRFEQS